MKRTLLPLTLALLLAGCAARDEQTVTQLAQQERALASLEKSVSDVAKAAQAPRPPSEEDKARDRRLAGLEARLDELSGRLAKLEQAAAKPAPPPPPAETNTPAAAAAPTTGRAVVRYQNKPPVISVYSSADARAADFIETPAGSNPDLVPVRVSAVAGRRVQTGTHPAVRQVETDEIYKDEFGRERKRLKDVVEQVPAYEYEVAFALENLTRTEKVVACTAGAATRMLTLQAGEKRADVVVKSEMGASLRIEVGSEFKRYNVTY